MLAFIVKFKDYRYIELGLYIRAEDVRSPFVVAFYIIDVLPSSEEMCLCN